MAQLPKGGLVRGHDQPIHGSCAIYFPGGIIVVNIIVTLCLDMIFLKAISIYLHQYYQYDNIYDYMLYCSYELDVCSNDTTVISFQPMWGLMVGWTSLSPRWLHLKTWKMYYNGRRVAASRWIGQVFFFIHFEGPKVLEGPHHVDWFGISSFNKRIRGSCWKFLGKLKGLWSKLGCSLDRWG